MQAPHVSWYGRSREGSLHVSIPPSAVLERLRASMDPAPKLAVRWAGWLYARHRFYGKVKEPRFWVCRWWKGRRLDDPTLQGEVRPDGDGSVITFHVKPAVYSLAFLLVFPFVFGGLAGTAATHRLGALLGADVPPWALPAALTALFLGLAGLFLWLFRKEGRTLAAFLPELFADVRREGPGGP